MLEIPSRFLETILDQARRESPRECCGLLAGIGGRVESIYPLANEATTDCEFHVAEGLFPPFRAMRMRGESLLAIYHSHPRSAAIPSKTDLERNYYPEAAHLIVSLKEEPPDVRVYRLMANRFEPIEWRIVDR